MLFRQKPFGVESKFFGALFNQPIQAANLIRAGTRTIRQDKGMWHLYPW
jgi:hypothetical protein